MARLLVDRAKRNFVSLETLLSHMRDFPVLVESEPSPSQKTQTRPDYFAYKTFTYLRDKAGVIPLIDYNPKREIIFGVSPESLLLQYEGDRPTEISFRDLDCPINLYLPNAMRARGIEEEHIIPIALKSDEFEHLSEVVLHREKLKDHFQKKEHAILEAQFDITVDPRVRNILRQIYRRAFSYSSSDIHFEWTEHGPRVRYRVHDVLIDDPYISPFSLGNLSQVERKKLEDSERIVGRETFRKIIGAIKVDAADSGVLTDQHRKPQTGVFDFDKINWNSGNNEFAEEDLPKGYRARVSILPGIHEGENVVLRLLKKGQLLTLNQLGYSPEVVQKFEEISTEPNGIILAVGPTGSGKTTTLNAIMNLINLPDQKIITIENPVEYTIHGIQQCEVSKLATFDAIMEEILRHDPDTVMLGEIRNKQTADIAIQLASTGHTAYATLHANDAISSYSRLVDLGVRPYEIEDTLRAVFAQRLMRVLCPACKQIDNSSSPNSLFKKPIFKLDSPIYRASEKGCEKCNHTGVSGRSAITEIWQISEVTRDLIRAGVNSRTKYFEQTLQEGMRPIPLVALDRLFSGEVSLEEVVRVAGKPVFKELEHYVPTLFQKNILL